jgi:hypothetical protein
MSHRQALPESLQAAATGKPADFEIVLEERNPVLVEAKTSTELWNAVSVFCGVLGNADCMH